MFSHVILLWMQQTLAKEEETMATTGVTDMGRVTVEIALSNYHDMLRAEDGDLSTSNIRRSAVSGIVDSGAARLVLPPRVVRELGVDEVGETVSGTLINAPPGGQSSAMFGLSFVDGAQSSRPSPNPTARTP
jgi:hypothetical protein